MSRTYFQRSPRLTLDFPKGEVEIPPPPATPSPPTASLITVLVPVFTTIIGVVLMYFVYSSYSYGGSHKTTLLMLGATSVMMLGSYMATFYSYFAQKRQYQRSVNVRQEQYNSLLENRRQELEQLREQQKNSLLQKDPDPKSCQRRVVKRDRKLWERAPKDNDFLNLRLGLGSNPFNVKVNTPKPTDSLNPDPLITAAQQLAETFNTVENSPVCLSLYENGIAGLIGARQFVLNIIKALVIQVATHHSPDEVKIAVIFPSVEAFEWHWIRWLPHVWSEDRQHRFMAQEKEDAHNLCAGLQDFLNRRKQHIDLDKGSDKKLPLPYWFIILADPRLTEKEAVLPLLLTEGPALGAFSVLLADRIDALPKSCNAIVEVGKNSGYLVEKAPAFKQIGFVPDQVPIDEARRFSRSLAPIRLRRMASNTEIPSILPLLDLMEVAKVEDIDAPARWRSNKTYTSLAAPIGLKAGGEKLYFSIHEKGHGPHGLVAGTTGSGKSELLQSVIASMAADFHPYDLSFVMVDYKGGGMANAFQELPHLAGTVTNLQGNLAARALLALKGELLRRQAMLAQIGVNHIDDYQQAWWKGKAPEPLSHLVIVVDEFAELKTEQPDFMRELVSAVRVGRSLGVHLILATQKPSGVVDEQIWSNTRFRICLRVKRPADSQEVLKRPDAAGITQPGRAYFQVGNDEIFEIFQAAYSSAPYYPEGSAQNDPNEIAEVKLNGARVPLLSSQKPKVTQALGNQLQAVVGYLRDCAIQQGINKMTGPWMPPLPEKLSLAEVRPAREQGWDGSGWQKGQRWMEPVIGMLDNPASQFQGALTLNLGKEGHLIIYGAPGSGKTTLLQTFVVSLAMDHSPQDVQLYLLDFGGRILTIFRNMPSVGGVVLTDESERVTRLLRCLLQELENRKILFSNAGVSTLQAYRAAVSEPLPAIVLILDNYTAFMNNYFELEDQLAQLAREGGNLGIHLVITASSPGMVRPKISNSITMALALQLAEKGDYSQAVGRTDGLEPAAMPGRGLVKGKPPLEFHAALPVSGDGEVERTTALKNLIEQMSLAWNGPNAPQIPSLPEDLPLSQLLQPADSWPSDNSSLSVPLGLEMDDLKPVSIDLNEGPHFLIASPVQGGKTTLLQTWLLALAEVLTPDRLHLYLVDFRSSGLYQLQRLPHVRAWVEDDERFSEVLSDITELLQERRREMDQARRNSGGLFDEKKFLAGYPVLVIALEDSAGQSAQFSGATKNYLEQILRRERGMGVHILLTGSCSDFTSCYDGWAKAIKELQTGFLLGSSDHGDLQLLNLRLAPGEAGKPLPPGQGFFSRRGRYIKFKAASLQSDSLSLTAWVEKLKQQVI